MKIFFIVFILLLVAIKNQNESINIDNLYFEVDPNYMRDVIDNLSSIIEVYVYLDISKNPPNSFHSKYNLKDGLNNIDISKPKPYYDFFRDITRVFANVRDFHLGMFPLIKDAYLYCVCIPFNFEIKLDDNKEYQIYFKRYPVCPYNYTDPELNRFIDDSIKEKISILSINGKDPFDYLQNFGKEFYNLKNDHAQFTSSKQYISFFPLYWFPLNETELNLTIKLSNNEEKTFSYFYFLFDTFADNFTMKPHIVELEWNYTTYGFRCRVDEKNKLNVFYQDEFYFSEFNEDVNSMFEFLYKCSKLFHTNNYKIVGIERANEGGGILTLPTYLQQLIQPKISKNTNLLALRKNEYLKSAFEYFQEEFLNIETCKPFDSFEEFLEKEPDDYGNNTKHYRSKVFDLFSLENKTDLHNKREELIKTKNTKKPTDIIIFTDYYSISATSYLLKGFQQTGGAIVVGYFGNPKIKNVTRDSSLCSSLDMIYDEVEIEPYNNLYNLGFEIYLTSFEAYSYDYQGKNPIPQEYTSYPVDEHVDIYEEYSDSNYQKFIDEAKRIFNKYENKCNKDNKLLLLEDDNCYNIEGDKHAHGGYPCGNNGEWDKTKCQAFYCDIGYYYDTYQKKCRKDICIKSDDDNDDDKDSWVFLTTIIAASLSILIAIIFIIYIYKKKSNVSLKMNENEDYGAMENE